MSTATLHPVDMDLAKQLSRVSAQINKLEMERERLILLAYVDGASLREIAAAVGMSHVGVKKLVDREKADWIIFDENDNIVAVLEAKSYKGPPPDDSEGDDQAE